MLDFETAILGAKQAVPDAGVAVIGGRPYHAGVMPELAVDDRGKWDPAMAGNDAVDPALGDLFAFQRRLR